MELSTWSIPGYEVLGPADPERQGLVPVRRRADGRPGGVRVLSVAEAGVVATMERAAALMRIRLRPLLGVHDVLPLPGANGRAAAVLVVVDVAEGPCLATALSSGHVTAGQTVSVMRPVARALQQVHAAGVVHGGVGPSGVFLDRTEGVQLTDLAAPLANRNGQLGDGLTVPELLEGTPAGPEVDIHGWGVSAWVCLTGVTPGWVASPTASLAALAPEAPADLRDLVLACLASEPADRPVADELVAALATMPAQDWSISEGITLGPNGLRRRRRSRQRPPRVAADASATAEGRTPGRQRRGAGHNSGPRARAVLVSIAAVVALALGGWGIHGLVSTASEQARQVQASVPSDTDEPRTSAAPRAISTAGPTAAPPAAPLPTPSTSADGTESTESTESTHTTNSAHSTDSVDRDAATTAMVEAPVPGLQSLLDARSRAWLAGDAAELRDAYVEGGAAWRADVADLDAAQELGIRYRGVAFVVHHVVLEETHADQGAPAHGARVLMRAEVERPDYQVQWPSGELTDQPGSTQQVQLELRLVDDSWRIWSWS